MLLSSPKIAYLSGCASEHTPLIMDWIVHKCRGFPAYQKIQILLSPWTPQLWNHLGADLFNELKNCYAPRHSECAMCSLLYVSKYCWISLSFFKKKLTVTFVPRWSTQVSRPANVHNDNELMQTLQEHREQRWTGRLCARGPEQAPVCKDSHLITHLRSSPAHLHKGQSPYWLQ